MNITNVFLEFLNHWREHDRSVIDGICLFADYKFSMYTPSMISAASVAAALHGLAWTSKNNVPLPELLDRLQRILSIEMDYLQSCLTQIEELVTATMSGNSRAPSEPSADRTVSVDQTEKLMEQGQHSKVGTPTDVRDIHF
ncbi:Belongs to the cyclin [Homalodisca vitripennis]|nr:Belongs to the cyclin [Homalodisca vitripennis]